MKTKKKNGQKNLMIIHCGLLTDKISQNSRYFIYNYLHYLNAVPKPKSHADCFMNVQRSAVAVIAADGGAGWIYLRRL